MSLLSQQINNPFGITVFGSALIRVSPDIAVLHFSVTHTQPTPKEAFDAVHKGTATVRKYLAEIGIEDVKSSQVTLSAQFGTDYKREFVGYKANTGFTILVGDLEKLEDVLIGIVNAGVNHLGRIDMQTTQLKKVRAQARQQAVEAAYEKAELYCESANVTLGSPIHIEDVNPDQLFGRSGHIAREIPQQESEVPKAFDPGSIDVRAGVMMAFSITNRL